MVRMLHMSATMDVSVNRVLANIGHEVYHPGCRTHNGTIVISAMNRPQRRDAGPVRTARILDKISVTLGASVELVVFGAADKDLIEAGIPPEKGIVNRRLLSRNEVSAVLRASDLFLDRSDFQSFGRTGLEAIASGCVPLLPLFGGADKYALNWQNAIVVNTRADDEVLGAIKRFTEMPLAARMAMYSAGIAKALE